MKVDPFIFYMSTVDLHPDSWRIFSKMHNDSKVIDRRQFLNYVDKKSLREVEVSIGFAHHYRAGKTMASSGDVTYYSGTLAGSKVYFFFINGHFYIFKKRSQVVTGLLRHQS